MPRRELLRVAGIGLAGVAFGGSNGAVAKASPDRSVKASHRVPADKQLDPAWVKRLFKRGVKEG